MMKQLSPCSPWMINRDAEIYLQSMEETHTRAGGGLKESVTLWEAHAGTESWQTAADPWERTPQESRFPGFAPSSLIDHHESGCREQNLKEPDI
ncbi:hypothetical protein DUI87_15922 [Hirundo rustica rustica]|uniref:Uncharacterized protein n=1 Tax=Hirundo rustica rustica TaxID=333673 RepID=A0A3M0K011_HIRRU|nr:hypothetical protein DUI87_15922 [Hirundo rustica rustica]